MALADAKPFAVAHWSLDEASGTRFDSVGSNDLTDNNTVASDTGMFGSAADFEAGNPGERLSIADNTDLSSGDVDLVVRCWVKFESLDATRTVLCKAENLGDEATTEYALYGNASAEIHFRVSKNGQGFGDVAWSSTLSTGVWYLVHGWHDSVNNEVGIAVNAGTAVTTAWAHGINDTAQAFHIGDDSTSASRQMDGLVDDAVILKGYILDATERTEDYNAGAGVAFADWDAGGGAEVTGAGAALGATTPAATGTLTRSAAVAATGQAPVAGAASATLTAPAAALGQGRAVGNPAPIVSAAGSVIAPAAASAAPLLSASADGRTLGQAPVSATAALQAVAAGGFTAGSACYAFIIGTVQGAARGGAVAYAVYVSSLATDGLVEAAQVWQPHMQAGQVA